MKVAYYFRSYRKGVYSIEVLFRRILASLGTRVTTTSHAVHLSNVFTIWIRAFLNPSAIHHITGHVNYIALGLKGCHTILTVHDIGHYTQTLKGWRKYIYKKVWFDWPLRKVALITTVSEFSKQQLITFFSIDASKVKVIYNPFPALYKREDKIKLSGIPKILQIGAGDHKNLNRLIHAVQGIPCELILIRTYDAGIDQVLKQKDVSAQWFFDLTDEAVCQLYQQCDLVFFASTYEGFGMPIVEAQATGRAVITSNCASMPEIAGEGAVLVDPYKVEEIRDAIIRLLSDDNFRNACIEKGYSNLQRFHPEVIARQYLELYTQIYSN
ncbi:MAG: glycosyltransferase family 4 protein [Cytophagaceae bacterium]|nr:glycosyltransferase family 4 protein [Cytophagaceae bacterium]